MTLEVVPLADIQWELGVGRITASELRAAARTLLQDAYRPTACPRITCRRAAPDHRVPPSGMSTWPPPAQLFAGRLRLLWLRPSARPGEGARTCAHRKGLALPAVVGKACSPLQGPGWSLFPALNLRYDHPAQGGALRSLW